ADDAAGLAIATRMRAKEGGLNVGARNTQDAMSALRTTDSALNSISNILLRMRDLATQSANGTNDGKDQDSLNLEFKELQGEIDHIAGKTNFNGKSLLAAAGTDKNISIQLSDVASDNLTITAVDATTGATGLGLTKTIGAPPAPVIPAPAPPAPPAPAADNDAAGAIVQLDAAIQKVADMRATFGSQLNRLDHNLNNVNSQATNMAASASQIEDADMAKEMSEMTKFKILNEAGISMLSQANQTPQMVSKLLQ
ncbi:TPA: flagellin, partial [Bacillus cereus]